ncbi:MAG TPA: FAD binding domain-containing protein [Terriglobales bacterium]|nr:FAD binding domain-containing protein [Terriglobales bacterium]
MIPFDFMYFRPDTLREATETWWKLSGRGLAAHYYAGGSETVTLCRAGAIRPDAVIDVKRIPELTELRQDRAYLHIGAACTLNQIKESKFFTLLELACGRIADHTNQCRITIGGNLCGAIIYRETSLPLLLADATVSLIGPGGERTLPLQSVFRERMRLFPGELVTGVHVPVWALTAPCAHLKKTANEKIDYPLVSVAAIKKGDALRAAFSGICPYPFRSGEIEAVLNDGALSPAQKAKKAAGLLPESPVSDAEGSGEYRLFVFENTIRELLEGF